LAEINHCTNLHGLHHLSVFAVSVSALGGANTAVTYIHSATATAAAAAAAVHVAAVRTSVVTSIEGRAVAATDNLAVRGGKVTLHLLALVRVVQMVWMHLWMYLWVVLLLLVVPMTLLLLLLLLLLSLLVLLVLPLLVLVVRVVVLVVLAMLRVLVEWPGHCWHGWHACTVWNDWAKVRGTTMSTIVTSTTLSTKFMASNCDIVTIEMFMRVLVKISVGVGGLLRLIR
jgi:hypothetical protein